MKEQRPIEINHNSKRTEGLRAASEIFSPRKKIPIRNILSGLPPNQLLKIFSRFVKEKLTRLGLSKKEINVFL